VLPNAGPGVSALASDGRGAPQIATAAADGELAAIYLLRADPLETHPDRALWDRALERASTVIAHAQFLTDGVREHATIVFPAEAPAEKEGTVTHPDGRIQRLRPAIAHPGDVGPEWQIIADLARRLGGDLGAHTGAQASAQLFATVPVYAGLTLDELGGHGVRWPARAQASAWPAADAGPFSLDTPPPAATPNGALRLGSYRSIWAGAEVANSPSLKFLGTGGRVELSPVDAQRLRLGHGDRVVVAAGDNAIEATVALRDAMPVGSAFVEGTAPAGGLAEVRPA
jgi:NADH-quinone oxidoreductase subunit G